MPAADNLTGQQKFELYQLATQLLAQGKSQEETLKGVQDYADALEYEWAKPALLAILEAAATQKWDRLAQEARQQLGQSMPYNKVQQWLQSQANDPDVAHLITESLYAAKTEELEAASDARTLQAEGKSNMLFYGLGAAVFFFVSANTYLRILWAVAFVLAVIIYLLGLLKAKKARQIHQFFNHEQNS